MGKWSPKVIHNEVDNVKPVFPKTDNFVLPVFMDCVPPPHIIGNPCAPRWVVKCEHGIWFYYSPSWWTDKRNEFDAYVALFGLAHKIAVTHDTSTRKANNG
jgi:hypothetical protein